MARKELYDLVDHFLKDKPADVIQFLLFKETTVSKLST